MSIFDLADKFRKERIDAELKEKQRKILFEQNASQNVKDGVAEAIKLLDELNELQTDCGSKYSLVEDDTKLILRCTYASPSSNLPQDILSINCIPESCDTYSYYVTNRLEGNCMTYIPVTAKTLRSTVAKVLSYLDTTNWERTVKEKSINEARIMDVDHEEEF
jgi:hypothetical protein